MDASRQFVCIRLATYEDQAEANYMKKIFVGRSGNVENTTFAILSPDGQKKLTRAGRAPFYEYRNAARMASGMNEIATRYQASADMKLEEAPLPLAKSLDLGLNISAADGFPLIVIVGNESSELNALSEKLRPLAWSDDLMGQYTYVEVTDAEQLKPLTGIEGSPEEMNAILVVEPDRFGLSGKVLAQFNSASESESMRNELTTIIRNFEHIEKGHDSHVQLGIRMGVEWDTAIPETDPEAVAMRKRARGRK